MTRHCRWHGGDVPDTQAREVYATQAASRPEQPVYACDPCIRAHGLLPVINPTFIGREHLPPIPPGRPL